MQNLYSALIEAQKELQNPPKDTQGYGYKYTDLATLINEVKPVLSKHGLAVVQMLVDGKLMTRLIHSSGEHIESGCDLLKLTGGKMNELQAMGASITYMRRYAISALLCIASEDDTDGAPAKTVEVPQPIAANNHAVPYAMDVINNAATIEQLDKTRLELLKKKWSIKDAADLKVAIETKRIELTK